MADELDRRAAFAETFKNTTNLDQRRRFAQDISEAKAREEERANAEFEQMQRDNPELMNAVTRRQAERRMLGAEVNRRDLAERKFQWDQEKGSRLESLNAKRLEIQMRQEQRALNKEERELERLDLEENDMEAIDGMEIELRQMYGPNSPEYKQKMMEGLIRYPNLKKEKREAIAMQLGYQDPETALNSMNEFLKQPGARVTGVPLPGGGRGSITPPDEDIDREILQVMAMREKAYDEATRAKADEVIQSLNAKKAKTQTAQPTQPAQQPTQASQPGTTVATTLLRRQAPDGTIWLFDPSTKKAVRKEE